MLKFLWMIVSLLCAISSCRHVPTKAIDAKAKEAGQEQDSKQSSLPNSPVGQKIKDAITKYKKNRKVPGKNPSKQEKVAKILDKVTDAISSVPDEVLGLQAAGPTTGTIINEIHTDGNSPSAKLIAAGKLPSKDAGKKALIPAIGVTAGLGLLTACIAFKQYNDKVHIMTEDNRKVYRIFVENLFNLDEDEKITFTTEDGSLVEEKDGNYKVVKVNGGQETVKLLYTPSEMGGELELEDDGKDYYVMKDNVAYVVEYKNDGFEYKKHKVKVLGTNELKYEKLKIDLKSKKTFVNSPDDYLGETEDSDGTQYFKTQNGEYLRGQENSTIWSKDKDGKITVYELGDWDSIQSKASLGKGDKHWTRAGGDKGARLVIVTEDGISEPKCGKEDIYVSEKGQLYINNKQRTVVYADGDEYKIATAQVSAFSPTEVRLNSKDAMYTEKVRSNHGKFYPVKQESLTEFKAIVSGHTNDLEEIAYEQPKKGIYKEVWKPKEVTKADYRPKYYEKEALYERYVDGEIKTPGFDRLKTKLLAGSSVAFFAATTALVALAVDQKALGLSSASEPAIVTLMNDLRRVLVDIYTPSKARLLAP